jgi:hypothetical protein
VVVLGCGSRSDDKAKAPPIDESSAVVPKGRVTSTTCEVSGDYVLGEVEAAVKAEAPAWLACADRIVTSKDPTTGMRIIFGDFQFSWTLKGGKVTGRSVHTVGDGQACVEPILTKLLSTPAFANNRTAGTLSCTIKFDDSSHRTPR